MKKLLFIYNMHSGRGKIKQFLAEIIDIFVKGGYEVTAYSTQSRGDATRAVKERNDSYDIVACSGGDGTLDEVVSGMIECENQLPIGYIPAGSTNDFAGSLGISKNMITAAHTIVDGKEFNCDLGKFNDRVFVYVAAFGMFTDVSYDTDQHMKNMLGHLAYIIEGAKRLPNTKINHFVIDYIDENDKHHRLEHDYLLGMVTNSKYVGGFKTLNEKLVTLDDGVFEVTLVRRALTPVEFVELAEKDNSKEYDFVTSFRAKQLTFVSDEEVAWTLDGEFGGKHTKADIINQSKAIKLIVPNETV